MNKGCMLLGLSAPRMMQGGFTLSEYRLTVMAYAPTRKLLSSSIIHPIVRKSN